MPNDASCDDGDACTLADLCSGGECTPGPPKPCDDGDGCTSDSCSDGECGHDPIVPCCGNGAVEAGEQCDDGDQTSGDGCSDGCVIEGGSCGDGQWTGAETDVDCGGGTCPACKTGRDCKKPGDCVEGVCEGSKCAVPDCPAGSGGIPVHTRLIGSKLTPKDIICRPADSVFSLFVLPDTQTYTAATSPWLAMFEEQVEYVRTMYDHAANRMIFMAHLGDLLNNAKNPVEYPLARKALEGLKAFTSKGVWHYLPYDIAWGDHDVLSYWDKWTYPTKHRPKYSEHIQKGVFSAAQYKADQTGGGTDWWERWFRGWKNRYGRTSYHFFDAGGDEYMIVFLEFCPNQDVITWVADRLSWYAETAKDKRAILVMHSFIDTKGGLKDTKTGGLESCWEFENESFTTGTASDIYEQLVVPYNVVMVLSGHDNGGGWKGGTYARMTVPAEASGAPADRAVHVFLSNYQYIGSADPADGIKNGKVGAGLGYLRVMRFYPDEDRIDVTVWSEWSHDHNGGKYNPVYAAGDSAKKNPLGFAGAPDEPFNENEVCVTPAGPAAAHPGACAKTGWKVVPKLCGDLGSFIDEYTLDHGGPPHYSFIAQCNKFSVPFEMTGTK